MLPDHHKVASSARQAGQITDKQSLKIVEQFSADNNSKKEKNHSMQEWFLFYLPLNKIAVFEFIF